MLGLEPKIEPDYRLLGTLVHTRLAFHYAAMLDKRPDWYAHGLDAALAKDAKGRLDLVSKSENIYEAYCDWWVGQDTWQPLAVEEEFSATLQEIDPDYEQDPNDPDDIPEPGEDDELVTAKLDLMVRSNGTSWVVDHKTKSHGWGRTGRMEDWHDEDFMMSWQVHLYLHVTRLACRRMGWDEPQGFIIQRLTRKLPFDSDRTVVPVPQLAHAEVPRMVRHLVREELKVRRRVAAGFKPVPNYASCVGAFGPCDFFPLCSANSEKSRNRLLGQMFHKRVA